MNEEEIYEFDLNGYIILRDLIPPADVARMNEILDQDQAGDFPLSFQFLKLDPMFMDLMAHPRTLKVMRTIIGDWLRLDHSYGLQMTNETEVRENLHGGLRTDQGEHQYQWAFNQMWNGLIVIMYALEDINPGDGGLICVPGSHKSNLNTYKPPVDSHLVVQSFVQGRRYADLHRSAGTRYDPLEEHQPTPGLALQILTRLFNLGQIRTSRPVSRLGAKRPTTRSLAPALCRTAHPTRISGGLRFMSDKLARGIWPALVTPFTDDGSALAPERVAPLHRHRRGQRSTLLYLLARRQRRTGHYRRALP